MKNERRRSIFMSNQFFEEDQVIEKNEFVKSFLETNLDV